MQWTGSCPIEDSDSLSVNGYCKVGSQALFCGRRILQATSFPKRQIDGSDLNRKWVQSPKKWVEIRSSLIAEARHATFGIPGMILRGAGSRGTKLLAHLAHRRLNNWIRYIYRATNYKKPPLKNDVFYHTVAISRSRSRLTWRKSYCNR